MVSVFSCGFALVFCGVSRLEAFVVSKKGETMRLFGGAYALLFRFGFTRPELGTIFYFDTSKNKFKHKKVLGLTCLADSCVYVRPPS